MANVSITYKCCGATYALPTGLFPAHELVPRLDKLHAEEHPSCPPLDAPLPPERQP